MEFSFPEHYYNRIEKLLNESDYSLAKPHALAKSILDLSDHYIHDKGPTPWQNSSTLVAYISYFFPLNYIRARSAIYEISRLGFLKNIDSFVDFGSGPGTLPCAFRDAERNLPGISIEHYKNAPTIYQNLSADHSTNLKWHRELKLIEIAETQKKLLLLSYSLLELGNLPEGWDKFNSLLIIEPSDRLNGRNLLGVRDSLIKSGYKIWAPCTHQQSCPLLSTKADWCHHRVFWQQPKWFKDLENQLPIKNKTLTYSFLAASRQAPPPQLSQLSRLTGDQLDEKGKVRQMVCRNSDREFLSWLKKVGRPSEYNRGDLIKMNLEAKKVSNEIRLGLEDISVLGDNPLDS